MKVRRLQLILAYSLSCIRTMFFEWVITRVMINRSNNSLDVLICYNHSISWLLWQRNYNFTIFIFFVINQVMQFNQSMFLAIWASRAVDDSMPSSLQRSKAVSIRLFRFFVCAKKLQKGFVTFGKVPQDHIWINDSSLMRICHNFNLF